MKLKKQITELVKVRLSFPTDDYKIDDLLEIDRPRKELYSAIKYELYQLGCAISDCCADGLAQTHSINEIIIANLVKHHGFKATQAAKDRYLLVKEAKFEEQP